MWVNKALFEMIVADNKAQQTEIRDIRVAEAQGAGAYMRLAEQKAKDDITIDWMRHQVNALSKQNALLIAKAAGIHVPVPEIVPTRPGSMTVPDFSSMPSFEDVGDDEATRLGIAHSLGGELVFQK